ncbi:AbrB family transcriptional regulator [Arthrobacter sp. 260]|nr:AbrB family transcriptional regulator [Arthrobacter sp. 260]NOJ60060.1 AbrB family transcriptional regulator [Arthrobacter sp. 260]
MLIQLLILLASGAAGSTLGYFLRLPMWPITGALLGSAAANVLMAASITMPFALSFTAQVLVGTAIGASVMPGFLGEIRKYLVPAVAVVVTLVAAGISAGVLMSALGLLGLPEALLGMVPGGVGEMVAAASVLDADSALVAGIHVIRLLITLWTLPLLIKWAQTWKRPPLPG